MLVGAIDAGNQTRYLAYSAQDTINDASGALLAPATFQVVLPANPIPPGTVGCRSGFLFQNTSEHAMLLNEINQTATSSWVIYPGDFFPPYSGYPIPTGAIEVSGFAVAESAIGDTYVAREWVNAS